MTSPLLNQPAPDFIRETRNGQQVRLADYRIKRGTTTMKAVCTILCVLMVFAVAGPTGRCRAAEDANDGRIVILSDTPQSRFVRSIQALYPGRVEVFDLKAAPVTAGTLEKATWLVTEIRDDANLVRLDAAIILKHARSGGTAVLGLDEFARLNGLTVVRETLPRTKHVPDLTAEQWQRIIAAAAKICGNLPNPQPPRWLPPEGNLPEAWMNDTVKALRAEVLAEVPRVTIIEESPLTTGFARGDSLPWCGQQEGRYVQRQIQVIAEGLRRQVEVIAVSSFGQRPVFARQQVGKGAIYAMDFRSLDEPQVTWETRGSFNKYVFLGNLIGHSLRLGHYWSHKPLAEQWGPILRKVAAEHPPLRVEADGHVNGYNVYSLNLGDPSKPLWYALGMYHAEDEWRSALGLVDFMRHLADHREHPTIKRQLERYCVKVIPCQHPGMYMKALRGDAPGPEPKMPTNPAIHGKPADIAMALTIHECDSGLQLLLVPMTAASLPLMPAIKSLHEARMADRFIEWPGGVPQQAESRCQLAAITGADAERQRYYGFGIGYEPLYNIGKPSFDKLPYALCLEGPRRGILPEVFLMHYQLRGLIWEEDLYRSAVVNEIVADWTLSALLTSP